MNEDMEVENVMNDVCLQCHHAECSQEAMGAVTEEDEMHKLWV